MLRLETDLRQAILALSDALDLAQVEEQGHGKRVALAAWELGQRAGLTEAELDDAVDAALLHDLALSDADLRRQLSATGMDRDGAERHAHQGARLVATCSRLGSLAPIIALHHSPWEAIATTTLTRTLKLAGLVYLCDRADVLCRPHRGRGLVVWAKELRERIAAASGTAFDPAWVEVFLEVSRPPAFWIGLEGRYLGRSLEPLARRQRSVSMDFPELRALAGIFAQVVDAKSRFTAEHSEGVARLCRLLGDRAGLDETTCDRLELAGLLHDLGKLGMSDAVLDAPGPLSDADRAMLAHHSYDGWRILQGVPGLEDVARWAAQHHETPAGDGYPFCLGGEALTLEARIVAVADVFQALAQDRPYRPRMPLARILEVLGDLERREQLDGALVRLLRESPEEFLSAAVRA